MTKRIYLCALLLLSISTQQAQRPKDPDAILLPPKDSLPKIFLVGSFHFEYYNLDAVKIAKDKQIDILSEKKQAEVKALIDYIALFKPNKICIEARPTWNAMNKYRDYASGKKELNGDEIQQIAFRLMKRFKLDTVYSVDVISFADDILTNQDSLIIKPYIDSIFKDYSFKTSSRYIEYFNYMIKLQRDMTLLDYFKYQNSPKVLQRDYGAYLLGDFKLPTYKGVDALTIYWYSRNLRIFRNIQTIAASPEDRILVLFGAGHIAILDQLLNCTPEFDYIRFNDLKK